MNKAFLLSLNPDANISEQWDFGFLKDFLEGEFFEIKNVDTLPKTNAALVVIPARHHKGLEHLVNEELKKIERVVLFLMGDEEADFEVEAINHPDVKIWVQNPHMGRHDKYNKLGTGYPQHMKVNLPKYIAKTNDIFFAGQVTHPRRRELVDILIDMYATGGNVKVVKTAGFTQGEAPSEYYKHLTEAKIAPAPSGAVVPDSFRLFEALECMALVVADQKTPDGTVMEYWDWLFGEETPLPKVVEWDRLFGLADELLEDWPQNMFRQTAWWLQYKRNFRLRVIEQLEPYYVHERLSSEITVVIPTSVLPSHPSTKIIDETIENVRVHLPNCDILLQIDGLRDEQLDRKADYDKYKTDILWKCLHKWKNVTPIVFDELQHQSGMIKATIDMIKTPLMLYVEGDAPLTPDRKIDWLKCIDFIMAGKANTIRFHHENVIPTEHEGLMLGVEGTFTKTYQWSQRPHLSTVEYYRNVVLPKLPERSFIEDTMHGVVANDWYDKAMIGWYNHRLWIYTPTNGIQRSYTTDGRAGGKKFTSDDEVGL